MLMEISYNNNYHPSIGMSHLKICMVRDTEPPYARKRLTMQFPLDLN